MVCWTGFDGGTTYSVGIATSDNGITGWTAGANPIATGAEDPYIAKTDANEVWRDSSNRALVFTEEKVGETHIGIDLYRSAAGTLDGWTKFGQVLAPGAPGTWSESDVTSPTVIHDGTRLVMLYEGRSPTQQGQIGYAVSNDESETWTEDANPIITQNATWATHGVVPDDLLKDNGNWVLIMHGGQSAGNWFSGRYITADAPVDWDSLSFTEMAGNPFDQGGQVASAATPARAVRAIPTSFYVARVTR